MVIASKKTIAIIQQSKIISRHILLYEILKERYCVAEVLSLPLLLHRMEKVQSSQAILNATIAKGNTLYKLMFSKKLSKALSKKAFSSIGTNMMLSFLATDESLYELLNALWRVYHSNNLRLSHSLFRLINLITERGYKLREILPLTGYLRSSTYIKSFLTRYHTAMKYFLPNLTSVYKHSNSNRVLSSAISLEKHIKHIPSYAVYNSAHPPPTQDVFRGITQFDSLFFASGGILPILERIYEGIESNYLFYNSSSYQSVKTLYRLTNSLWKIYSGHNLELSRNFVRLITSVNEKNSISRYYNHRDINTLDTPHILINTLRRAFLGNNLHLRHSLISLIRDIRQAGENTKSIKTEKSLSSLHEKRKETILLLHRFFMSNKHRDLIDLKHPRVENISPKNAFEKENLKRYLDERLKTFTEEKAPALNTEALINKIIRRIKDEQSEQWRHEKLRRGLF